MIRNPAVAGAFYPGDRQSLEREMSRLIREEKPKKKVRGLVSPHAGYIYSGRCAGRVFGKVEIPDTVIILGVNHRGFGHSYAVDGHEYWRTPLGDAAVDTELAREVTRDSEIFGIDRKAGLQEHSLEVQVPFVQTVNPRAKILPITISSMDLETLMAGGREIGEILKKRGDIIVIASTDMSHFIDAHAAEMQDRKAIDRILSLDPEGLFNTVVKEDISMCGMAPTVMMLSAVIESGARQVEMVDYTHSGETTGDSSNVVAYLGMLVY